MVFAAPAFCSSHDSGPFFVTIGVWLTFAMLYGTMQMMNTEHFLFTHPWVDPLYFAGTVTSTVGFGDIVPRTAAAKWVVLLNQVAVLGLAALFLCVITRRSRS